MLDFLPSKKAFFFIFIQCEKRLKAITSKQALHFIVFYIIFEFVLICKNF